MLVGVKVVSLSIFILLRLVFIYDGPDTGSIGSRVTEWTARGEYSLKAKQSKRKL